MASGTNRWFVEGKQEGRRSSHTSMADIGRFPLLPPPPMHSSTLSAAMCPTGQAVRHRLSYLRKGNENKARFIPRCFDCIRDRYCAGCNKWWCETCYVGAFAGSSSGHAGLNSGDHVSNPPTITGENDNRDSGPKILDGFCADGKCSLYRSSTDSVTAGSEQPA